MIPRPRSVTSLPGDWVLPKLPSILADVGHPYDLFHSPTSSSLAPRFSCVFRLTILTMAAFVSGIPRVGAASLSATRGGSAFVCGRPAPVVAAAPSKARWTMMPIGVPKVAYRVPGAPSADWVDIYNRLYRERIIFLGQEIDDEVSGMVFRGGGWRGDWRGPGCSVMVVVAGAVG